MKIFDLHNDIITGCDDVLSQLDFYKNSDLEVITAYFRGSNTLAKAVFDIEKYLQIKPKNCYLALEDIGYTNLEKIEVLFNFKPIYVSLTWNGENSLGYGCDYPEKDIKKSGFNIIDYANKTNTIIDTAHISKTGFFSIIEKADKVICSHTAFNSVYNHKRNLTDLQIKLLIEKGGIIGLVLYSDFINGENSSIEDWVKHIDYFVNKFGYNNLCIGSDFFGAKNFINSIKNYQNFSKIVEKLIQIGYNIKVIENIFYLNAQKYFKKVLKG